MKTPRLRTIVALSLLAGMWCDSVADSRDPTLDFVASYLLGKVADTVWDSATGKPDLNELQQRIQRLEQLLGESSGPIRKLGTEVSSTTTLTEFHKDAQTALDALRKAVAKNPDSLSHIYVGSVGKLKAVFSLSWGYGGRVSGVYCNPTRDADKIYELSGSNVADGRLVLNEYTDGSLSARIDLVKDTSPAWIIWKGKMHNTDGRVIDVAFQRERK